MRLLLTEMRWTTGGNRFTKGGSVFTTDGNEITKGGNGLTAGGRPFGKLRTGGLGMICAWEDA